MYTNEEIEIMLWDYIDGDCTEAEKIVVQELIATDHIWQERYTQFMQLHTELQQTIETEQPSMRFTKNVMDSIAASVIAKPARTYVNKWIVRGIAAFFIITLGIVTVIAMGYMGRSIDFSGDGSLMPYAMKNFSFAQLFSNGTFLFTIAVSTVAGLAFLDTYRTRRMQLKRGK